MADKTTKNELPGGGTLSDFKGTSPYDAQYIGTFQPILGWRSKTTQVWINHQYNNALNALFKLIEADLKKAKSTAFGEKPKDAPELLFNSEFRWIKDILMFDGGINFFEKQKEFQKNKGGKPNLESLIKSITTELANKKQNQNDFVPRNNDFSGLLSTIKAFNLPENYLARAFESRFVHYQNLQQLLNHFHSIAPLSSAEEGFRLSPIGLLNLYKYYFYDFGSFLGPSIEHIWIGPNAETELIEVWSQTSYKLRESETSAQFMQATEESVTERTELSEEMQKQNEQNYKMGFTSSFGYKTLVSEAKGSLSADYGSQLKTDQKTVRKTAREQSSKTSSEMKRSVRLLTRESTETRVENTRRHLIKNPKDKPISFEMCRKLHRIGVQVQHIDTQLCWQIIIDEPGNELGLAELVHIAKPQDFSTTPPPDVAPPSFPVLAEDNQFLIKFDPITNNPDTNELYTDGEYHHIHISDGPVVDKIRSSFKITASPPQPGYKLISVQDKSFERTEPSHDAPSTWVLEYTIINDGINGEFEVKLSDVNFEMQPAVKVTVSLLWGVKDDVRTAAEGKYKEKMGEYQQIKQHEAHVAMVEALRERINLSHSIVPRSSDDLRDEERAILYRRVLKVLLGPELANASLHATADLIRTFFDVDKMLYFVAPDWWNPRMTAKQNAQSHMAKEDSPLNFFKRLSHMPFPYVMVKGLVENSDSDDDVIQYKYTCTYMMGGSSVIYSSSSTVSNPKDHNQKEIQAEFKYLDKKGAAPISFSHNIPNPYFQVDANEFQTKDIGIPDLVQFEKEQQKRPNNYMITEDSEPAPMGSSIGWLIQLDGDSHRNAFLNAAWARIVIPIYRGREKAAIEWLKQDFIEGKDGFDDACLNEETGKPDLDKNGKPKKTIKQAIDELVSKLTELDEDKIYQANQMVYENGFNPLEKGFEPGPEPQKIFSQWVEIVPTNQVVPREYNP